MTLTQATQWIVNNPVEWFKFVRFTDGTYAFSPMGQLDHEQLAEGREVVSAATIKIRPKSCQIEGYSSKLKKSYDKHDLAVLPQMFGRTLEEY